MSERDRWSFLRGVLPWLVWVGAFFALEFRALADRDRQTPPLTHVIVRWVPAWLASGFAIWALVHFGSRYLDKPIW